MNGNLYHVTFQATRKYSKRYLAPPEVLCEHSFFLELKLDGNNNIQKISETRNFNDGILRGAAQETADFSVYYRSKEEDNNELDCH